MRILYTCADRGITLEKHNGATAHFRSLVAAFSRLGHELLVLTPSGDPEGILGVPTRRIPTPATARVLLEEVHAEVPRSEREAQRRAARIVHALAHCWNNVATEDVLRETVADFQPDLVFELYSPFGVAGSIVSRELGVRHVLNVHAPLAWEGATFRKQALQEAAEYLEAAAFAHARRIVTNSSEMREQLLAAGVDASKIRVVINGVDLERFQVEGPRHEGLPSGAFVVGFCGSLKAWHGVDLLVDAFRKLAADPRFHLLVVGDGPGRKQVGALSDELPGRVTWTGPVPLEDVPTYLRAMDVAVAPYPRMERFYFSPLKVLEYMAVGKPCVASSIGQLPELVRDAETGLLTPVEDVSAFAAAIRRLADDEALRESMGRSAAEEVRRRHSWTDRAAEILEAATDP